MCSCLQLECLYGNLVSSNSYCFRRSILFVATIAILEEAKKNVIINDRDCCVRKSFVRNDDVNGDETRCYLNGCSTTAKLDSALRSDDLH